MKKQLTREDEIKVDELIMDGKHPIEISRRLNINYNSVYYYAKKNCSYKKSHKYTDDEIQYIKENYKTTTIDKISEKLGVPISSIYNKARSLGIRRFK